MLATSLNGTKGKMVVIDEPAEVRRILEDPRLDRPDPHQGLSNFPCHRRWCSRSRRTDLKLKLSLIFIFE